MNADLGQLPRVKARALQGQWDICQTHLTDYQRGAWR